MGFSKKDRSINIRRIGYISNIITTHGGLCICSNIAPYILDREYNKNLIESNGNDYIEIFINAKLKRRLSNHRIAKHTQIMPSIKPIITNSGLAGHSSHFPSIL